MGEEFRHNEIDAAFELWIDGVRAGYVDYELAAGVASFEHTVVSPAFAGRGLAGTIVAHAFDEARAAGWKVRPVCAYVQRWLKSHPEQADLLV